MRKPEELIAALQTRANAVNTSARALGFSENVDGVLHDEAADTIATLVRALEPFAKLYDESMKDYPDGGAKIDRPDDKHAWGFNNADISWGDFRRARAALGTDK